MGNVTGTMIGNLLTLASAAGAFALATLVLQNLLARRVRVLARTRTPPSDVELS